MSDLLDQYLESKRQTTSYSNVKKEKYHVEIIRSVIGKKKISAVTEADCPKIINTVFRHRNPDTGEQVELSRKTLQNIRSTMMAFFKYCRQMKMTTLCPESISIPQSARLKGVKILLPINLVTFFTSDQTTLYNVRRFDEYIYAYRFAVLTGLRPGELRALRPEDVYGMQLTIHGAVNSYNEHTRGKNRNALRSFTLSALAKQTLEQQMALFPNATYIFDIPSITTYRHRWTRYCQSNGIPPTFLYGLRHTFVSVVKCLPEGDVKELVGHSQNMDTFGTYGHQLSGDSERIANDVNTVLQHLKPSGNAAEIQ